MQQKIRSGQESVDEERTRSIVWFLLVGTWNGIRLQNFLPVLILQCSSEIAAGYRSQYPLDRPICSLVQYGLSHYQNRIANSWYPSVSFYTCWRFQLLTAIIIIFIFIITIIVLGLPLYILSSLLSRSFNSNWTVTVYSFVVYMYLIVSVDCIGFDHTLFIILYSAIQLFSYFCCKYVNKRSVFSISDEKLWAQLANAGSTRNWLLNSCHSIQYRSFRRREALSSDVHLPFSNGGPAT